MGDLWGKTGGKRANGGKGKCAPFVCLSAVLDLCHRRIVSCVLGERNDDPLVYKTFDKAVRANPDASLVRLPSVKSPVPYRHLGEIRSVDGGHIVRPIVF